MSMGRRSVSEPHSAPYDHHVQWSICPYCGALQDGAANMTNIDAPEPGDISICFECGEWAEFDDKLERVKLTDTTKLDDPEIQNFIARYWEFRAMYPERWPRG